MRLLVLLLGIIFIPALAVAEEKPSGAAIEYLQMSPKFTVNLEEPGKYLMINVQLLVEGADAVEKVKKHLPALRHELIMLYSGRSMETLQAPQQREALRQETFKAFKRVLEKYENSDGFKGVFFTEFLVG
ncbi:Flagellar protein FliL [Candidatus Methylobacter favarea]|uniref:Flagellar protein FliL n=1 Tax=Candidatus Methylobacter favarea TaxID=2707345 RepID=A0A8S0WD19_9GAMM|nr:flagellar basal body-associated FliL family protein [Candidatus Methylobacter favarea]CAA9892915.1 Flagellar protein FliL [Candidatus Methylobacter favarea]